MFNCSEGDELKTEVEILLNDEPVVLSVFGLATLFATAHRNGITADEALTQMVRMATDPTASLMCASSESELLVNGEVIEFDPWAITAMRAEGASWWVTRDLLAGIFSRLFFRRFFFIAENVGVELLPE